jgi:hypothetical protein
MEPTEDAQVELIRLWVERCKVLPKPVKKDKIKKEYWQLPWEKRWIHTYLEEEVPRGVRPPCQTDDCYWNGHMDRIGSYCDDVYLLALDEDVHFCEICVSNDFGEDEEWEVMLRWCSRIKLELAELEEEEEKPSH